MLGEDGRARDRLSEAAGADQGDVVLALRPEDLADLAEERIDVVADPALAEFPERRKVAPDLSRVDVRVVGYLLRGDALLPLFFALGRTLGEGRSRGAYSAG